MSCGGGCGRTCIWLLSEATTLRRCPIMVIWLIAQTSAMSLIQRRWKLVVRIVVMPSVVVNGHSVVVTCASATTERVGGG
jgi:hypothetical protein